MAQQAALALQDLVLMHAAHAAGLLLGGCTAADVHGSCSRHSPLGQLDPQAQGRRLSPMPWFLSQWKRLWLRVRTHATVQGPDNVSGEPEPRMRHASLRLQLWTLRMRGALELHVQRRR